MLQKGRHFHLFDITCLVYKHERYFQYLDYPLMVWAENQDTVSHHVVYSSNAGWLTANRCDIVHMADEWACKSPGWHVELQNLMPGAGFGPEMRHFCQVMPMLLIQESHFEHQGCSNMNHILSTWEFYLNFSIWESIFKL